MCTFLTKMLFDEDFRTKVVSDFMDRQMEADLAGKPVVNPEPDAECGCGAMEKLTLKLEGNNCECGEDCC